MLVPRRVRFLAVWAALLPLTAGGCPSEHGPTHATMRRSPDVIDASPPPARSRPASPPAETTIVDPVSAFDGGKERIIAAAQARAQGLTILDLGDDTAPYPFTSGPAGGTGADNHYRQRYLDLANNRLDDNGAKAGRDQRNYLELYGIPPSFSVLRRRFLDDVAHQKCYDAVDRAAIGRLNVAVHYAGPDKERRFVDTAGAWARAAAKLERQHKQPLAVLEKRRIGLPIIRRHRRAQKWLRAIEEAQKRLQCEGVVRPEEALRPGIVDWRLQATLRRFEHKHYIYGWGVLGKDTVRAMTKPPLNNTHRALRRTLAARIATQLGLIDDGTAAEVRRTKAQRAGNSVARFTQIALRALGWQTAPSTLAFLRARPADYFRTRRVAIRLPPPPAYYRPGMPLRARITRGDVWYDFPYAGGTRRHQPIERKPQLRLYTRHQGRDILLMSWGTTVGGWRTVVRHGCEFWEYKNSDVGRREWKFIVAGPVWLPPRGTPPRELLSKRLIRGRERLMANEDLIGPSHMSAYGLIATLHTRRRMRKGKWVDVDNGIRTHGSHNYMSIAANHSHGCHRLHNRLAVRLAAFLLRWRRHERMGQVPIRWKYGFAYRGKRFGFTRGHKGYYFRLHDPVPVVVTSGRIRGAIKHPQRGYFPKVGVDYALRPACLALLRRKMAPVPKGQDDDR